GGAAADGAGPDHPRHEGRRVGGGDLPVGGGEHEAVGGDGAAAQLDRAVPAAAGGRHQPLLGGGQRVRPVHAAGGRRHVVRVAAGGGRDVVGGPAADGDVRVLRHHEGGRVRLPPRRRPPGGDGGGEADMTPDGTCWSEIGG